MAPVAVQCVKDAIVKKDSAIKIITTSNNQAILTAMDARSACQILALDKTTALEQSSANKVCVDAFQKGIKDATKILENGKKEAQQTYQTDLKSCSALQTNSATVATETNTSSSVVSNVEQPEIKLDDGENSTSTVE